MIDQAGDAVVALAFADTDPDPDPGPSRKITFNVGSADAYRAEVIHGWLFAQG